MINNRNYFALRISAVSILCILLLAACDASKSGMLRSDNPLQGKIYQTAHNRFIDNTELTQILQTSDVLLVGETHDNPEHHQIEANIMTHYLAQGQSGLVALEMVTDTQLENVLRDRPQDASQLIAVLKQEGDGWEYDKYYKAVFQAMYDAGFMLTAANLNRKNIAAIVMQDDSKVPANIKSIIEHVSLSAEDTESLQKEIESSHCGMLLGKHAAGMIEGQRVRDAYMAKAVVDAKTKADKALLLAGSGHVRSDRGVPIYIKYLAPNLNVVTIGLAEVVDGHDDPQDYASRWGAKSLPFDYVWFTKAVDRPDPCEELRRHMKNMPHAVHNKPDASDK